MPIEAAVGFGRGALAAVDQLWRAGQSHLCGCSFSCGFIALIEPSPYDLAFFLVRSGVVRWWLHDPSDDRAFAGPALPVDLGGYHLADPLRRTSRTRPGSWPSRSTSTTSALFLALFFAEDTERRAELCLKAYAASTVCAGHLRRFWAISTSAGSGELFSLYGRASGTFKDPNVFGPYLVMGAVYYIQNLLLRRTRHVVCDPAPADGHRDRHFPVLLTRLMGRLRGRDIALHRHGLRHHHRAEDPPPHRPHGGCGRWPSRPWRSRFCFRSNKRAICSCSAPRSTRTTTKARRGASATRPAPCRCCWTT